MCFLLNNKVTRELVSWLVSFPGSCKGTLRVVWHEAWPTADFYKQ